MHPVDLSVDDLQDLRYEMAGRLTCLAGLVLVLWDHSITFSLEVDHIWFSDWTIVKLLFLMARYSPYVDVSSAVFFNFATHLTTKSCWNYNIAILFLSAFGMAAAEAILILRAISICDLRGKLLRFLLGPILIINIPMTFCLVKWAFSVKFDSGPAKLWSCHFHRSTSPPLVIAGYAFIAFLEGLLSLFNLWMRKKNFCPKSGSLMKAFYADEQFLIYCFCERIIIKLCRCLIISSDIFAQHWYFGPFYLSLPYCDVRCFGFMSGSHPLTKFSVYIAVFMLYSPHG
ncbi:hypothetical protein CPB83DRAFT_568092 [Crepidotus variabilis]|uniref:DUF6533 domain-containing protein n=1 Tax=Crepidotus variabilis TaxID=179855 RepID=A0A9P6JLC6_9AGAR|nr:hypothetical protein CPB83DRAFT_568092 [Crepidotus variabilis]